MANIEMVDDGNPIVPRRVNNIVDMINNLEDDQKIIVILNIINGCELEGCPT